MSSSDIANSHRVGPDPKRFRELEQGFAKKGWRLYPLNGDTLLATIPKWGMSRTLTGFDAAEALLRQIGGAA